MLDFQMSSFGVAIQAAIECFNESRWENGQIEARNVEETDKKFEEKIVKVHEVFAELEQKL